MSAPVVIPCAIPGALDLLEFASPVRLLAKPQKSGVFIGQFGVAWALAPIGDARVTQEELGLDLGARAGAWRAAIWIVRAGVSDARWPGLNAAEVELIEMAIWAETLSVERQAELRDLALRLAAVLAAPRGRA